MEAEPVEPVYSTTTTGFSRPSLSLSSRFLLVHPDDTHRQLFPVSFIFVLASPGTRGRLNGMSETGGGDTETTGEKVFSPSRPMPDRCSDAFLRSGECTKILKALRETRIASNDREPDYPFANDEAER